MNDLVKSKIKWKNQFYEIYTKMIKCNHYLWFQEVTNLVLQVTAKTKKDYQNVIASKLKNPKTSAET